MENNREIEMIQSLKNEKVKSWIKLKQKKGRNEQGLLLIEGLKLLFEAISSNQTIKTIIIEQGHVIPQEIKQYVTNHSVELTYVSNSITMKLADTEQSQGFFTILEQKTEGPSDLLDKNLSFLLIVDEIQDPGNLGTIIRSSDAAGVDGIILGEGTVDLYNPKVIRSSMGSLFHIPIVKADLDELIQILKSKGFQIVGTSPYAVQSYFELDFSAKIAVIVGNEAKGLSEKRQLSVDKMVTIPMLGEAESLNVAMATTLILYERVRQISKIGLK